MYLPWNNLETDESENGRLRRDPVETGLLVVGVLIVVAMAAFQASSLLADSTTAPAGRETLASTIPDQGSVPAAEYRYALVPASARFTEESTEGGVADSIHEQTTITEWCFSSEAGPTFRVPRAAWRAAVLQLVGRAHEAAGHLDLSAPCSIVVQ